MTERTMAERDAQRAEGYYWIRLHYGADFRPGPAWDVALWDPTRSFYGPGWFIAGQEEDLVANAILDVNETRLEPPDTSPIALTSKGD